MANIDKSNLRQVILNFPHQFQPGLEAAKLVKTGGAIDKIVICGMGGSALAGALLKMVFADAKILEIIIWRNYGLPANLGKNTLIIAISYSGNTEETLSAYRSAINIGAKLLSVASGGKLEKLSQENKTPFIKIPESNIPPRSALGYIFAMLFQIFINFGLIPDYSLKLLETAKKLNPAGLENQGKTLAKKIGKKIPLIYASDKWAELTHTWKVKFNENSKIPAFCNVFPELHHNEMDSFDNFKSQNYYLKNFHIIILEDENENLRINEGIKIFIAFAKRQKVPVSVIPLDGNGILEKTFRSSISADWTSYHLALIRGLDPTPIKITEEFKKRMAS